MWFAQIFNQYVEIYIDNILYSIPVKKCRSLYKTEHYIYLINNEFVYCFYKNKLIYKKPTVSNDSNKIIIEKNIYISDEDSGTLYQYDMLGNVIKSKKIGEHISDFAICDSFFYIALYHENKIIKYNFDDTFDELEIKCFPQKIIVDGDNIYLLANNQFYSFIYLIDKELNIKKKIIFRNQIGQIFQFTNKLIFNGCDYNYILNKNLNVLSQKKSTGESLCRFGNLAIFEKNKKTIDLINNIIYPL